MERTWSKEIQEALAAPFQPEEIDFLPRTPQNGRALALPYIGARSVMQRLDAVVGPENWSFDFDVISPPAGTGTWVKGRLTVLGITKCDAGEGGDEDEPLKSAVSDALKRCAVHFGVGRYLYYLPKLWAPYDATRRRFVETPQWPAGAIERAVAVSAGGPVAVAKSTASEGGPEGGPEGTPSLAPRASATGTVPAPRCSAAGCGRSITRAQHDVSVRGFGRPLCPACQRQQARASA